MFGLPLLLFALDELLRGFGRLPVRPFRRSWEPARLDDVHQARMGGT